MSETYVTIEQCEVHRGELTRHNSDQDVLIAKLDTSMTVVNKFMFSIIGVLISGFVGTIFAVLSAK